MTYGNEPAHPIEFTDPGTGHEICFGLTKREYFAAMAMQGFLSNPYYSQQSAYMELKRMSNVGVEESSILPIVAERSVEMADCLIAALNK